jgi:Arc/MetJ-type ribon-helix-helix transcriptional regulator
MQETTVHDMATTSRTVAPKAVTIRPTQEDNRILAALVRKLGINASAVIRQALRVLATKEKVRA